MRRWALPVVVMVTVSATAHSATNGLSWAATQTSYFDVYGQLYFDPIVATANGDVYLGLPPQGASPTNRYGDLSTGSTLLRKVNANGSSEFLVQIGGAIAISAIAVDSKGNAYISGPATGTGLPVTSGAYRSTAVQADPGYLCGLDADGALAFCTYLDTDSLRIFGAALDPAGNIYLGGSRSTVSPPVRATPGALSLGNGQIVVMKLAASGSGLVYTATFGGSGNEFPQSLAVDPSGTVYVSGVTSSADFPVTADGAVGRFSPGGPASPISFVALLNPQGSALSYASYGDVGETSASLAVGAAGDMYLTGIDLDGVWVRKYAGHGPTIAYERRFSSGSPGFSPTALAVDEDGNADVIGTTSALNFPLQAATQACPFADSPAPAGFLIRLSPAGEVLQSTYLPGGTTPFAIAVSSGLGYVAALAANGLAPFAVLTLGPENSSAGKPIAFWCVGNAASLVPAPLAPGEVVSLFGDGIGPLDAVAANLGDGQPVTTQMAGTQVLFDGVPAPLLYVQAGQINAITPWGLAGKGKTQVCIVFALLGANCITANVAAAAPGVAMASPGNAAAINQDGTVNSPQNPAELGSIVSLYTTGIGSISPSQPDGAIIQFPLPTQNNQVQVLFQTAGQSPGEVLYAGPAPFEPAGVTQINVRVQAGSLQVRVLAPDGTQAQTGQFSIATKNKL